MWKDRILRLNFLALCAVAGFPLLHMRVTVFAIIFFTLTCFIAAWTSPEQIKNRGRLKMMILLLIPFILILLRTWLMDPSESALFYLEVSLSLAVFPLAFFFSPVPLTPRRLTLLSWIFILSTCAIVLYGEISVFNTILKHLGPDKFWKSTGQMLQDVSLPYYIRTLFEETVSIHPTYASLFLGIALLMAADTLFRFYSSLPKLARIFLPLLMILICFMQVALASRMPFIGTLAAGLILVFLHVRRKKIALLIGAGVVVSGILLIILVPTFSARFREISLSNASVPEEKQENSTNLRTGIYYCSMEIIRENWITGIGPGRVQQQLNECYSAISPEVYDEKNYNTHNQFLDYWAGLGIAGPLSLLAVIGFVITAGIRYRNYVAVAITLLFFISFFTENLLTRQNGVVAFAFFTSLFSFALLNRESTDDPMDFKSQ
jgi:O-antigen ligase